MIIIARRKLPGKTIEERENDLIVLAVDEAERQLREGCASSQIISHYLRLATTREQLEKERLRRENKLLEAKEESIRSMKRMDELYAKAIEAMREYSLTPYQDPNDL